MRALIIVVSLLLLGGCSNAQKKTSGHIPTNTAATNLTKKSEPECAAGSVYSGEDYETIGGDGTVYFTGVFACKEGKWVIDEEATAKNKKILDDEEAAQKAKEEHRDKLYRALITRPLTESEMDEVWKMGEDLLPRGNSVYYTSSEGFYIDSNQATRQPAELENDRHKWFMDALYQQHRLKEVFVDPVSGYVVTSKSHVVFKAETKDHNCELSIEEDGSLDSMSYCEVNGLITEDTIHAYDANAKVKQDEQCMDSRGSLWPCQGEPRPKLIKRPQP